MTAREQAIEIIERRAEQVKGNLYSAENWYGFAELTTLITIEENGVRLYTPAEYEEEKEVEEFLTFEEFLKRG